MGGMKKVIGREEDPEFRSRPGEKASEPLAGGILLRSAKAEFRLEPPLRRAMTCRSNGYAIVIPYTTARIDLKAGDGPLRRVRLRANSVSLFAPPVDLAIASVEPVELLLVAIDAEHLEGLAARGERRWQPADLIDLLDPAIATVAHEMRRTVLAEHPGEHLYLEALLDALIIRIGCNLLEDVGGDTARESLSPGMLTRLVRHIEAHLDEELRVEALAELAGLSRSHFSRAFQRATGDPPQRFLLKRRICRARDLLSSGEASLAEVAVRSGFSSQAHFTTAFRNEVGTTPARYREAFRKGAGADNGS